MSRRLEAAYNLSMGPLLLESERLFLREFRPEDESSIQAYASDPEVTRFTDWGPNDPEETREFLKSCLEHQKRWPRESVPLAMELKSERRLIGGTGFAKIDFRIRTATFGYVLHRDYWGQGFATEASRELLTFGFQSLSLHRIVALCDVRHQASSHILEKLGMRREGHFRKDARKAGEWRDTYLYAALDEEWVGTARA